MLKHMNCKPRIVVGLLALLAAGSSGVLVWALGKSWSIGAEADATGGNGGTDQILWLWLFLSLVGVASSVITILVILSRQYGHPRSEQPYSRSG